MSSEYEQRRRLQEEQSREQEMSQAQQQSLQQAQRQSPLVDLQGDASAEVFDRLTDEDIESSAFQGISEKLAPWLSDQQMLASHDDGEHYDDIDHEMLNKNVAERIIAVHESGRNLTGKYLQVAQDVRHEKGGIAPRPLSPMEKEALRAALVDVRTDRQSLGDGTFLSAATEMHAVSEVRREDETESEGGGLLSAINPF